MLDDFDPLGVGRIGVTIIQSIRIYCVVEGRGRTVIDDQTIEWGPRDLIAVPGWRACRHQSDEDAVLFSVSDKPMQTKFGLWREESCGKADG